MQFFSFESSIGLIAGVLTAISMLPQLFKMVKEKSASDVSVFMLLVLMLGLACWVGYGIIKMDLPIMITNSFSFFVNAGVLFFRIKYRNN